MGGRWLALFDAPTVRPVQAANAILGESPLWDDGGRALYWIDILRPAIYRFEPGRGQTGQWPMPSAVGAMGLCAGNRLIVALEHEAICLLDLATGMLTPFGDPVGALGPENVPGRFNDGRVDRLGNFWTGWLTHDRNRAGALFRVGPDGKAKKVLDDPVAANGFDWSPDGDTFYFTDSHINTIWAYECDLQSGALGRRRALAQQDRNRGIFDGLCVDEKGDIWTALYGGGAILCLSPQGLERTRIDLPVRLVTGCAFGGPGHKSLFVTSAVRGQGAAELAGQPLAGAVFEISPDRGGRSAHRFTPSVQGDAKPA
jgi:sugar lactone lactonase YvrE